MFCPCNWNYDFIDVFVPEKIHTYIYIYVCMYVCIFLGKKYFSLPNKITTGFVMVVYLKFINLLFPKKKKRKRKKKSYNLLWLLRYHILHSNNFS